jgi:hypothetical protein
VKAFTSMQPSCQETSANGHGGKEQSKDLP